MEVTSAHPGSPYSPMLTKCLKMLRERESELRARGVLHAAIFGSVARGEDDEKSDVDVIVQVDYDVFPGTSGLIELEEYLSPFLGRTVDVISLGGLKTSKHDHILAEMVSAF